MIRYMRYSIILSLGMFVSAQHFELPGEVTKVGTAAANWLKLDTGARGIAMGGAQTAAGEGMSGVPYNPANITFIQGSSTYYSKTNYLLGISHNVLAYGSNISPNNYIGLHLFYLDSGAMEITTEAFPDGTGADFHFLGIAFRGTYARVMTDRLKVGVSIKYVREQIHTTHMQTFALDIGSNFDTGIYGFHLGMSVSNFGPEIQYTGEGLEIPVDEDVSVDSALAKVTEKFSLPLTFRLGIKNDIMGKTSVFVPNDEHRVTVAMDGINPIDFTTYGGLGVEYAWKETAFIRGGTRLGHDTAKFTFGAGAQIKTGGMTIGMDYAYANFSILENTHQFAISLGF